MSSLGELIPAGGGQNNTDFVASGNIASGKPVILNSTGTATQVAETASAVAIPYGSTSTFSTTANRYVASDTHFDPVTKGRVGASYNGPSDYPSFVMGTHSGSSITWGTAVVLVSTGSNVTTAFNFDPNNANEVVFLYQLVGTGITARQGTISGSGASITTTLGTPLTMYSDSSTANTRAIRNSGVAFDPSAATPTFLAFFIQTAASNTEVVRSGTISGTSITAGSSVNLPATMGQRDFSGLAFNTAGTWVIGYPAASDYMGMVFGSISSNVPQVGTEIVVISSDSGRAYLPQFDPFNTLRGSMGYEISSVGYAQIFTLANAGTGTTVSTGTQTAIAGNLTSMPCSVLFNDVTQNGLIITFQDAVDDLYMRPATYNPASSNAMTLGTAVLVFDFSAVGDTTQKPYGAGMGNGVAAYTYTLDSNSDGTIIFAKGVTNETNMTATNLLGIAAGAITNGASGAINTWGSRNEVQTSLTVASDYYVQGDGTITTASASPAQLIGQAITATQINIKDYTG